MEQLRALPLARARADTTWFWLLWTLVAPLLLFPQRLPLPGALGAAGLLLLGLLLLHYRKPGPAPPFTLPLLVYLSLSTVALLVAPLPEANLRRLTTLLLGAAAFYGLFRLLATAGEGPSPAGCVVLLPLLGSAVALLGLFSIRWPARYFLNLGVVTGRLPHLVEGFTINHNQLAGTLVLLLLPGIFAWPRLRSRAGRWGSAAALLLLLLVLLLTQSRNGLLSLGLGLAAGLLWARGRFRLLFLLFTLSLLLPLGLGALPSRALAPLTRTFDTLDRKSKTGVAVDQSWLARLEMWSVATHLLRDYPVVGAGLYQFEQTSRANEHYQAIRPDLSFSHAHNLWLQIGTGLGWPGWLAAVLLWLAVLLQLARATRAAPSAARWTGVALGAAFCGYLTFNSFDVLALEQRAGLLVWLLLALAAAFVRRHEPETSASSTNFLKNMLPVTGERRSREVARARVARISGERSNGLRLLPLAPLLLFVLLLPWLPRNLANLQLDRARLHAGASQLPDRTLLAGDHRRLGLLRALQGQENAALAAWHKDPEAVPFLEGQGLHAYFQESDPAAALVWYRRALALDPAAATTYFWQGAAYHDLGHEQRSLTSYRQTVVHGRGQTLLGRNLPALAWEQQGRILASAEQWAEAATAFGAALALEPQVLDYRQQLTDVRRALAESEQQGR